jgi:prepilin-type N-terminal cleavage/methylation domain-containing protein
MDRHASGRTRGFTLIELLIVVIVIGILAAVAIPTYLGQRDKAKEAALKEGVHIIQEGVVTYAADHDGAWPATEYVTCTPGDKTADNLGNKYLDVWPRNPWTGQPMKNTGSSVLFNTNFASLTGMTPYGGAWKVVNGQLVAPVNASGQATGGSIGFGSTGWTDVTLDVNATLSSGPGVGVFFRTDGKPSASTIYGVNSGYCFQVDPGIGNKFVVRKWVNGAESGPIATASMSAAFIATMYTQPHDLKVSAVGSHIVCTVDGVVVLDFNDSTYASGAAGLRAWYGSAVNFLSAQAQGGGGTAGSGDPAKGDFAYAYGGQSATFGLVGWMAGGNAWVVQPMQ